MYCSNNPVTLQLICFHVPFFCVRFDFAAFMKMDENSNKNTLDKMLATLPQDKDWSPDDPYEATCLAGDLVRYHFGFASSSCATSLTQEQKDSVSVQSDFMRMSGGVAALENTAVNLQVVVKAEHEEEKLVAEKLKEVNKNEKELCVMVNQLKKTKSLLLASKKAEGDANLGIVYVFACMRVAVGFVC